MVETGGLPHTTTDRERQGGELCRVEWVIRTPPFTYASIVKLFGSVSYRPLVKSSPFPFCPLTCACSLASCREESASPTGERGIWPESCSPSITLPSCLPSSSTSSFCQPSPLPPPLFVSAEISAFKHKLWRVRIRTHTNKGLTNRPAWHTEDKNQETAEGHADCFLKQPSGKIHCSQTNKSEVDLWQPVKVPHRFKTNRFIRLVD